LVHKDMRLSFDGNRYCVPARYVGHKLTVKGDASSVTIYDQHHEIVCYARCWQRGQTFGAERFEKELHAQMAAADRSATQQRLIALLGPAAQEYLERLADTDRSLSRQVRELFVLVRELRPRSGIGRACQSARRTRLRRRLHRQHPPPAAPTARGATAASVQRSGAERTRHRSAFTRSVRRFHSSFPKGVP